MEAFWISRNDWEPTSLTSLYCWAWSLRARWSCTVISEWTGIYISWLSAEEGPGVLVSRQGPSPAHPNNSDAVKRSSLPTLIRLRHPWQHLMMWHGPWAPGGWRQLPWLTMLRSLWLATAVMALSPQQLSARHIIAQICEIQHKHVAQYFSSLSL